MTSTTTTTSCVTGGVDAHGGGDRNANRALYVAVLGQLRYAPRTRAHV